MSSVDDQGKDKDVSFAQKDEVSVHNIICMYVRMYVYLFPVPFPGHGGVY